MSQTLRVVLTPRASVDARRLLTEAATLARALDAELAAMFVEESDLLRCVALPFSVEVGLVSGAVRATDFEATRRLLERSADTLRALVAQHADELGLRWSFSVARGNLLREAVAAAAAAPVLLAPPRSAVPHSVGKLPTSASGSWVAVLDSATVAGSAREPATESTGTTTPSDRIWAIALRFAGADAISRIQLEDLLRGPAPRVLVVPLASVTGQAEMLERVLASARCPVVLVA